jgi:excinuclease ABC subunit C
MKLKIKFKYLDRKKISLLPKSSGVYLFKKGKEILYIGKAGNIRERVKNHFQQPSFRDNLFIEEVEKIGYLKTDSEIEALILEAKLIKKYQPKFNVLWRDDKNYFFVGITKEEFPRIFLTHQPKTTPPQSKIQNAKCKIITAFSGIPSEGGTVQNSKSKTVFIGPFIDGKALKQTLRVLRRVFPYRSCKKIPKRPCLWYQLGRCPAPCCLLNSKSAKQLPNLREKIKKISQQNAKNLLKILQGKKIQVLKSLKKQMKVLANFQEYELAAKVKNQINALKNVLQHANIFSHSEAFVLTKPWLNYYDKWKKVEKELKRILKTKRKIERIEGYDISNIQGQKATGAMIVFEKGKPNKKEYRKFKIKIAGKPNDVAMIREVLTRRLNHPEWRLPQVILIDGGRGQLNAAISGIRNKELGIRVMALAKRKNELYIEGKKKPISLNDLPQEVANLILRIRDEAHRFAIKYHRKLREIDFQPKS